MTSSNRQNNIFPGVYARKNLIASERGRNLDFQSYTFQDGRDSIVLVRDGARGSKLEEVFARKL